MKIRKAIATDARLLSSLCVDVQSLHAEHYPDIFKVPLQDDFAASFFDGMLADSTISIFIADEDGQALGYVLCKIIDRPEMYSPIPCVICSWIKSRSALRHAKKESVLLYLNKL